MKILRDKKIRFSRIIALSILLASLYWFFESFIHYFEFGFRGYWQEVLYPDVHEMWMRGFVVVLFLVFGLYTDFVVQKKEQAEENARIAFDEMDKIFNTAADGMRIIDKNSNVLKVNDTLISLNGFAKKEAENKKCYHGFPGVDCGTSKCPLDRIIKGEKRIEYETKKECKNGKMISCIVTATPFYGRNGKIVGIIEDFKDITARKKSEMEAKKAKENLEKKIKERTKKLEKIQKELVATERLAALGKMSSMVAHELRNPMGVIKLATYSLKKKNKDKEDIRHLENIDKKINEADQIIHDLLTFSSADSLDLAKNDINKIIEYSLSQGIEKFGKKKNINIVKKLDKNLPKIKTDFNQLVEVFYNIFLNGMQSMQEVKGKVLTISTKQQDSFIVVEIRDRGTGISKENLKKVGFPFFSTKTKGIGLGLYIAYEIIHRHKGEVEVQSKIGKGSIFKIKLPLN